MNNIYFAETGSVERSPFAEASCDAVLALFTENPALSKEMESKQILGRLVVCTRIPGVCVLEEFYESLRYSKEEGRWEFIPRLKVTVNELWEQKERFIWAQRRDGKDYNFSSCTFIDV